jgi:hypothetical protein
MAPLGQSNRDDKTMLIEQRINASGLYLPEPARIPSDVILDFAWARVFADRVYVSGHGPQAADGTVIGPFGRVGVEVTPEQAAEAARFATLAVLGSVKRAIGDLDRIAAWLRIDGFVPVGPGFDRTTNVVNVLHACRRTLQRRSRKACAHRGRSGGNAVELPRRDRRGAGAQTLAVPSTRDRCPSSYHGQPPSRIERRRLITGNGGSQPVIVVRIFRFLGLLSPRTGTSGGRRGRPGGW